MVIGYGRGDLNDPKPTFWNTSTVGEKMSLVFMLSMLSGIAYALLK